MAEVQRSDGAGKAFVYQARDALLRVPIDSMPPPARCIWLVLASHAEQDGSDAWPSIARLRAITGYSLSVIVASLKALTKAGWLAKTKRFDPKTGARTSTSYQVRLIGEALPSSGAREKRKAASKLPPGGTPVVSPGIGGSLLCQTQAHQPGDTITPNRETQAPLVSDTIEAPMRIPGEDPKEAPIARPPARAGVQQALPLGSSSPSETSTPKDQVKAAKKPRAKAGEPRAEDLYARAYLAGHEDAGYPMTALNASERGMLGAIAAAHGRYRDKSPITGEPLLLWIRKRARAFREAMQDVTHHPGKYTPFGFRAWLDAGHDGALAPQPPGWVKPPPEPWKSRLPPGTPVMAFEDIQRNLAEHGIPFTREMHEQAARDRAAAEVAARG